MSPVSPPGARPSRRPNPKSRSRSALTKEADPHRDRPSLVQTRPHHEATHLLSHSALRSQLRPALPHTQAALRRPTPPPANPQSAARALHHARAAPPAASRLLAPEGGTHQNVSGTTPAGAILRARAARAWPIAPIGPHRAHREHCSHKHCVHHRQMVTGEPENSGISGYPIRQLLYSTPRCCRAGFEDGPSRKNQYKSCVYCPLH